MAKRYIEQFMWGYQDLFRMALKVEVNSVLKSLGIHDDPRTILIGFQVEGQHEFDICIEQGEGYLKPSDFAGVEQLARQKYDDHPERRIFHSHPQAHENHLRRLHRITRTEALRETLESLPRQGQQAFFVANSVRLGDYEVHIIISVDKAAIARVPRIKTTTRDRFSIYPSLFHAAISRVLELAVQSLYLPHPGASLNILGASSSEVVRTATESFMHDLLLCAGYWSGAEADLLMNNLAALPYEGRAGSGRLVFASSSHPAIDVLVKLHSPVNTRKPLAVRKLLEASGPSADVLSDGDNVYGLGNIRPDYDSATETVFVVTFTTRGAWELSHAGVALLSVKDGVPNLPTHILDEAYFSNLVERLFPGGDTLALLEAARAAGNHRHGAMLVISGGAAEESQRLSPQSWSVEPTRLSPELITQLTDMDGAVLLDPSGRCHAIGVILDGVARGEGDPARGSRLNNAVRYLGNEPPPAIVVVYSADGGVNILPQLRPRVNKENVDEAVASFLEFAAQRPPNFEMTYRAWEIVESFKFYLSRDQCNALNRVREELEDWRMKDTGMRVEGASLQPDPTMNDTYWI